MTTSRVQLAAVGGFVLIMIVSLIITLAVLAGRTGEVDEYETSYTNVAGLKYGTQVLYEGYPIGQVESVEPQVGTAGMSFRVRLSVIGGWRIPSDSLATIAVSGLLAPATIAIAAGAAETALSPGSQIRSGGRAGLFAAMGGLGKEFARLSEKGLLPLLQNIDAQVSAVGGLMTGDVAALLAHLREVSASLEQELPPLLADLRLFSAALAQTGGQLQTVLSGERLAELDRLLRESANTAERLGAAAGEADQLLRASGDDMSATTRDLRESASAVRGRIEALSYNLEAASRDLAEFSRQIRQDPSRVLRRTRPPDEPAP